MLAEKFQDGEFSFSLVSLSPINPINKAEGFYAKALQRLQDDQRQKIAPQYALNQDTKRLKYLVSPEKPKIQQTCKF
jgi:hypothetical protein